VTLFIAHHGEAVGAADEGESIRLFFSYRHTPALVWALLAQHRLKVLDQWITQSEEEGIFLCRRK
jgi:hypothetical protein